MHAGQHGDYLWEITNGQFIISSTNAKIGVLKVASVANRFNNDEQATWFAQGKIDAQLDELARIVDAWSER